MLLTKTVYCSWLDGVRFFFKDGTKLKIPSEITPHLVSSLKYVLFTDRKIYILKKSVSFILSQSCNYRILAKNVITPIFSKRQHCPRTTDAKWSLFSLKFQTDGLGPSNRADKFWAIWGILDQTVSIHFGAVSPLSMVSIIQSLFLQKPKPLYLHRKYLFGIGIWIWAAKN